MAMRRPADRTEPPSS